MAAEATMADEKQAAVAGDDVKTLELLGPSHPTQAVGGTQNVWHKSASSLIEALIQAVGG